MLISSQFFTQCCPVAISPNDDTFSIVSGFFPTFQRELVRIIGHPSFESLDLDGGDCQSAAVAAAQLLCLTALEYAIPQLDIVLTATGFGIVSTDTLAPASTERVKAVRESLRNGAAVAYDTLISEMRNVTGWSESIFAKRIYSTVFPTTADVSVITGAARDIDIARSKIPHIRSLEQDIARRISPELIRRMHDGLRAASLTPEEETLRSMLMGHFAMIFSEEKPDRIKGEMEILAFVEENIDKFPAYAQSKTYKANHFNRYENKAQDSCFFFG